ncbi:carbohydrate ABC transporter permease [Actinotalea sp.]|uniref:carbohydrate ABC transporter permease n=1 Tax=Actinotalea sp. TaxID=1872145 RepID=UPI003562CD3A
MTTLTRSSTSASTAPQSPRRVPRGRNRHPWWFLLPAFAFIIVFFALPVAANFVFPFTNWSTFHSDIRFVGFDSFADVLGDGSLANSLRTTLVYAVLVAIFSNVFGLALALLLERDTRVNRFGRAAFFLPVLMSALATGYVFQAILKADGALNSALALLAGQPVDIEWLGSMDWTIVVAALVHTWKWVGMNMLIFLAGLKNIPTDSLEAASIDGASRWQSLRLIKIPLLAPAFTFNIATGLLSTLNSFDVIQALTGGGPARSTEVLNIFIFRTFGSGLYAQSTAMSLVLFLVVVVLAIPVIGFLRGRERAMS